MLFACPSRYAAIPSIPLRISCATVTYIRGQIFFSRLTCNAVNGLCRMSASSRSSLQVWTWSNGYKGNMDLLPQRRRVVQLRTVYFCAGSDPFEAIRFQQRSIPSLPYNRHLLRLLLESLNGSKVYLFINESVVDSICNIEILDQLEFFKFTQLNEFTTVRKAL